MVRRDITMRILPTMCMLFLSLCFQVTASPNKQGDMLVTIDANNTTIKEILHRIKNQTGVTFFYNTNHLNDKERVSVNVIGIRFEDLMKEIFRKRGISWSYNDDVVTLQTSLSEQGKKRISFTADNLTLKDVFKIIQKQTGLEFYYNLAVINVNDKVTMTVHDRTLDEVLGKILTVRGLGWQYYDKIIRVKPLNSIAASDSSITTVQVSGKITDASGTPIPGATIIVKGTKDGTTSDEHGEFSLPRVPLNKFLVVRSVGYEAMEVPAGRNSILVKLSIDLNQLDETVIIGYGQSSKRLLTGNVSRVSAKDIRDQPIGNPLAALQGRVPGLQITQQTGMPGGGYSISLRGKSSIGASNDPLIIVDGIPFPSTPMGQLGFGITYNGSPLSIVNPQNIESIEILKDADATAIYGSRAANGVILITTKRGKIEGSKLDINVYSGVGRVTRMMKLLNTDEYLMMRREAFANDGLTPTISRAYDLLAWDSTKYTNWQEKLIGGTSHNTNAQVSLSGGNSMTKYLIGARFSRESTVFPGDFRNQKANVHFNISNQSRSQRFKINLSGSYGIENNNLFPIDLTYAALSLAPNAPDLIGSDGRLAWPQYVNNNALAYLYQKYNSKARNLISNASVSYQILKNLEVKSTLGYNRIDLNEISTNPASTKNPASGITTGSSAFANSQLESWIIEPQITWNKRIRKSSFSLLAGATFQQSRNQQQRIEGLNYSSDLLLESIRSAGEIIVQDEYYTNYKYSAVFGRASYNYDDRYLVNVTGRRDGSSRFGPGRQFANFGAVGVAWIFTNEKYLKDHLPVLSFGKARASFGTTGNDAIQDYQFFDLWQPTNYPFQGISPLFPVRIANPDYGWERNKKLEVAIELGFLDDRLFTSISRYRNRSDNQLVSLSLPPSTGYESIQANLPAIVQNSGWEIEAIATIIKKPDFNWSTSFNITIPKNKLLYYPNIEKSPYANVLEVGKSLYIFKGFHSIGVNPNTGIYEFQDIDKNGSQLDYPGDLLATKMISQQFYGGLQNSVSFKGFQVDLLIQFVKQDAQNSQFSTGMPGTINNQPTYVLNRWQNEGDITEIQKFSTGRGNGADASRAWNNARVFGDNGVSDASFVRLKNVSLSYHPFRRLISKTKIDLIRIYLQAQNILTITSYKGLDPESINSNTLPPLKMFTAGFQVTL